MPCESCKTVAGSYDKRPFVPPNGSMNTRTHVCGCGRRWWQYSKKYHLWSPVDDEATWQNILHGRKIPVSLGAVGEPARNAY